MKTPAILVALIYAALVADFAYAEPDRESLISAWEAHIASLPATEILEKKGEDTYQFNDTDLPYEGELKLRGALVRSTEPVGYETGFTHFGMVEFELTDMPAERLSSQVYYFWLADRQTLHYSDESQEWVDAATYQASFADNYNSGTSFGALSFMMNYGIWLVLLALLLWVLVTFNRQVRKARATMDQAASINQQASKNLDRAEAMQDEVLSIARETRDLQKEGNELLRKMLDSMR